MNRHRRAVLAAVGTVAVGGCTGPTADRASTDDADSATDEPSSADRDASDEHESHETTIGFAGDTMVGRDLNRHYGQAAVDPAAIWGDVRPRLESLDGSCCNLECCLSTRGEPFSSRP